MSVAEIIEQIRALPPAERQEVVERIESEFIDGDELSPEQKAELQRRADEMRRNPQDGIPWETVRDEVRKRFGWK